MNVGIFGVQGFGWSLRQHEARCAATSATTTVEATTTEPMLAAGLVEAATTLASRVEVAVDVSVLREKDSVRCLHVPKDELKQLWEADVEMASAVMLLGLLTWRPGSSDAGPLCLALGMGPGDDGEILVKARPGRLPRRAPCQESALNLELLSNELPPKEHMDTNSIVNFNEDFRDIALRRCAKLQQVRKAWRPI
ncbi:NRT2.5 [Symbiodinium necroappetens]|uniref:NRT2.5 protein n=1 Tax=Symbiodinium necroappetens TaxID=1628268 RepID=A0A812MY68_9DINO|nr:NRT2.5 [Symbiodinium necroappetens]